MKFIKNSGRLFKQTYEQILQFNIGLHGAAIAFYAIFSTAPLIIILVWLLSMVLGGEMGQARLQQTLYAVVGPGIADSIQSMADSATHSATGLWSSMTAVAALLFGATTLLSQVKHTLNMIWGVRDPAIGKIGHFLWSRFKALLFVGALSLLLLVGLISESILYGMEQVLILLFGVEELFLIQLVSSGANVVLAFVFFLALFRILPDLEVRLRDIAVGALFTALLFMGGKMVVGWYLSGTTLGPAYKTAGSFVVFLIWIYYNVQIVLVGAFFTREYTRLYGEDVVPYWEASLGQDW
ncbi:membrane protein [Fodinibius roseus]|uniref:Membrane protein n=1 Tax=Fodinibius roseus TaxID=1194090 RepID=A0A1M4VYT1_9BACT|nr:YihY/virulence factor BrkB family protein [Fodinibius roseus]SHE73872.1 membrane protein [Fodinibius roseus]